MKGICIKAEAIHHAFLDYSSATKPNNFFSEQFSHEGNSCYDMKLFLLQLFPCGNLSCSLHFQSLIILLVPAVRTDQGVLPWHFRSHGPREGRKDKQGFIKSRQISFQQVGPEESEQGKRWRYEEYYHISYITLSLSHSSSVSRFILAHRHFTM